MDMESGKQQLVTYIRKYRYLVLILLLGILMMLVPDNKPTQLPELSTMEQEKTDLEKELAQILSRISGVGKTEVLLTEASGSDTIYQTDTGQNASNMDTVILMDSNREESGLVKQVLPPVYRGALVVCQGAERASIRLAVIEAVKSVTGLSSDCITVLKMK